MCGFSGIVADGDQQKHIEAMCRMLEHRGPENTSIYHHKNIWLGHNRLRIIDIETGDQPIFNEDRTVGVVFNGEIYNYKEIQFDLEQKGHTFRTNSDTEALVHLYEEKGLEMFNDLNGIFAFAILDKKQNQYICNSEKVSKNKKRKILKNFQNLKESFKIMKINKNHFDSFNII